MWPICSQLAGIYLHWAEVTHTQPTSNPKCPANPSSRVGQTSGYINDLFFQTIQLEDCGFYSLHACGTKWNHCMVNWNYNWSVWGARECFSLFSIEHIAECWSGKGAVTTTMPLSWLPRFCKAARPKHSLRNEQHPANVRLNHLSTGKKRVVRANHASWTRVTPSPKHPQTPNKTTVQPGSSREPGLALSAATTQD